MSDMSKPLAVALDHNMRVVAQLEATQRTALQEAVLRAACLWWLDRSPEDEMHAAIDRLLAAEPAWGKGE
jgi:hypothetical protein